MKLYFFTAADANPVYRAEVQTLIASGRKHGRPIDFYEIPADACWNRHKVNILGRADLPEADKYIYLDSDCILTGPGDWEATECQGVADTLYFCPADRDKHTIGFMRNHTITRGEGAGFEFVYNLWDKLGRPFWPNSGVVVLSAAQRIDFCRRWRAWLDLVDSYCEKGPICGDEYALVFARHFGQWPILPPRFNWMLKWQPDRPKDCCLIHADGNVGGAKRLPYIEAAREVSDAGGA